MEIPETNTSSQSPKDPNEDIVSKAKKILVPMQSPDRKVRKQCFVDLRTLLAQCYIDKVAEKILRDIFSETHIYFLNGLRDKSEAVREEATKFVIYLIIEIYPVNDFYLTYIIPVLVERIGTVELVEESEEVRLSLLTCLNKIIVKYARTEYLRPFFNDCVTILCESLKDKYSVIKELSCQAVENLSIALNADFKKQAETLLKPTLNLFSYQKYKVRIAAIKAVGVIVMHSSHKGVDEAVGPMAERLFDQTSEVRQTVCQVASHWLLHHIDRYSYFHKMIPLLLTGVIDEVEATRKEAVSLWDQVGLQYLKENEKEFKDRIDYLTEAPKYYPEGLERPNLGCRVLVQRNLSKLTVPLSNELSSWQMDVRVRCSQLLCALVHHAEEHFTFNLQNLLPAMYSAARDDDQRVVQNIKRASELIGTFVNYETLSKLLLPVICEEPHYGHLIVFAGIIEGSTSETIQAHLEEVSGVLATDNVCYNYKVKYSLAFLDCIAAISKKHPCLSNNDSSNFNMFKALVCVVSFRHPEIKDKINTELFKSLHGISPAFNSPSENLNKLFTHINRQPRLWTINSGDHLIFKSLLSHFSLGYGVDKDLLMDILKEALHVDADPESQLVIYYTLAKRFEFKDMLFKDDRSSKDTSRFYERLIHEVFIPALVWRAGSTAEAVRGMAITCLKFALTPDSTSHDSLSSVPIFSSAKCLQEIMGKLVPMLLSILDDPPHMIREGSVKCLKLLIQYSVNFSLKSDTWNDDFVKIYSGMLKRLDDPHDTVCDAALDCLATLFENIPTNFHKDDFKEHRKLLVDTLLTHLDSYDSTVPDLSALRAIIRMKIPDVEQRIRDTLPSLTSQIAHDAILHEVDKAN
ncbi:dynein axonemal assembly factor 5 [Euwallacea fornicatus]|uniref:dynein axonemal assembly factor 5 n=1 Tax=Euwallacea fornicatus TaxID=995702 RepID=UPI00338EAC2B